MVNTIPFVGTNPVKNQIASHFKVVETNINDTLTGNILSKAQVILIGERHKNEDDDQGIATVINGFGSSNIQLLLEGNRNSGGLSHLGAIQNQSLLSNAKSWDLQEVIEAHSKLFTDQLIPLLKIGSRLLRYFTVHLQNDDHRLDEFRIVATTWLKKVTKALRNEDLIIERTFFARNRSLVSSVQNALTAGAKKIIVIAGSAHITPSVKHQRSIDHLMTEIAKMSVPFAILNWKISVTDEVETDSTTKLRQAQDAAEILEEALYPLDMTCELLDEIDQTLNSRDTVSTVHITRLINELTVPMFAFKRCKHPHFME